MTRIVVRPFEEADLKGAATALVEVHATDGYPVEGVTDAEGWLRSDDVLAAWVAEAEGKVVGHVAVMRPQGVEAASLWMESSGDDQDHVAVLARLFVVKRFRKQATGERLMKAAMSFGQTRDRRLVLDVMAKDAAAIRLYERLGWLRIGETMHPYGAGKTARAFCYVAPSD